MTKEAALIERGIKLIEFYRQNPSVAAYDLLHVDLATPQRAVLNKMWVTPYTIIAASRGFGKTYLLAVFSVLKAMLYPGLKIGWISATFRQSKFIFTEASKLYDQSSIFRGACEKPPTRLQESWYIKLKGVGNSPGGTLEAVPLGDGGKIRGMRSHVICCDEFPQIPEEVFDRVVLPMAAVRHDPMARVRLKEKEQALKKAGLLMDHESLDDDFNFNQIVIVSSAYFKFNHFYKRYIQYVDRIKKGDKSYAVFAIPYTDMPKHFYEEGVIEHSRQQQSELEFRMEYMAEFVSDSEGFFKASLLKSCEEGFMLETHGESLSEYVMGVDPARTEDACGVVIIKLGDPSRVVYAEQIRRKTFQFMTDRIFKLSLLFPISHIYMDAGAGGGGTAIRDLLESGQGIGPDQYDPVVEKSSTKAGRKILVLINMVNEWASETNFKTLHLLEQNKLLFPKVPTYDISGEYTEIYDNVDVLLKQLMSIEASATSAGKVKFDVPRGKGHGAQKKDLYSAFILAVRAAHDNFFDKPAEEVKVQLATIGIIKDRKPKGLDLSNVPQQFKNKIIPGVNYFPKKIQPWEK